MIKRVMIMFLFVSFIFTGAVFAADEPSELELVLQEMDELVSEDMLEWLISLYDIERSGFYHAMSSRDNEEFLPDIESTRFAFDILIDAGILPRGEIPDDILSPNIKNPLIEWLQSMQDESDGYFYHPQWGKGVSESRKNRDLGAAALLRKLGSDALYPLPSERISNDEPDEDEQIPPYLRSEEALLNWMQNHWNNSTPYGAGNSYSSALGQIRDAGLIDTAVGFIMEKQNPETGLWGEGLDYINSNAAMKMQGFFAASNTPFPYVDKMIESITTIIMEGDEPGAVVDIWNPIVAINGALESYETIPPELQESIDQAALALARVSIDNIKAFKRDDGGYSYGRLRSSVTSQGAYVGYGLEEGDVNATTIATIRLRNSLYGMARVARPPLFEDTDFAHNLIQQWENLPPVQKVEKPIGLDEDFEDIELGSLPVRYIKTVSGGNRVEVAADPLDPNNQALLIERNALNSNSRLNIAVNSGEIDGQSKMTLSMDILIETPITGTLFYNSFGTNAVQWVISGHSDGFSLSGRRSGSGIGTTFSDRLAYGEWHNLKIEYIPDGAQFTIINYYIDDELTLTTNEYFNNGDSAIQPETSIDRIRFDNFNAAGILSMYIDNLRMTVEETDEGWPIGLDEDFEEMDSEKLPAHFATTLSGGNRIAVTADPQDESNQALVIERNSLNAHSRLNIPVKSTENPYKTVVSMDIMVESPVTGNLFYNSIGYNAVQWLINGHSDGFSLSSRRSGSGIGTTFTDRLAFGEWHNLKVEYIPDGINNTTIHFYVNDEHVFTTNEYFNNGNASQEPDQAIQRIRFDNFNGAGLLRLYVDNLSMTVEPITTTRIMERIGDLVENDAFANEQAERALNIHLTAVQVFERMGDAEKIVQHMGGFLMLLDHQRDQELISEQAYEAIKGHVDALIAEWR